MAKITRKELRTAVLITLVTVWCMTLFHSILFFLIGSSGISSIEYIPCLVDMTYFSAPEGTAYIDVLVKMDTSDANYTDFNAAPQCYIRYDKDIREYIWADLPVNSGSEIAKYNENGYVSLLSHCRGAELRVYNSVYNEENYNSELSLQLDLHETEPITDMMILYERYGDFKAAYVDKDGNVLGVTETFKKTYDSSENYSVTADGSSLIFSVSKLSPLDTAIILAFIIGCPLLTVLIPIIIAAMLIGMAVRKLRERRRYVKGNER